MKLASWEFGKDYVKVKEVFEASEAKSLLSQDLVVSGCLILAIDGESVIGRGLKATLVALRQARRPVEVRFGQLEP